MTPLVATKQPFYVRFPCVVHFPQFDLDCPACQLGDGEPFLDMPSYRRRRADLQDLASRGIDGRWAGEKSLVVTGEESH